MQPHWFVEPWINEALFESTPRRESPAVLIKDPIHKTVFNQTRLVGFNASATQKHGNIG
jgi:hypothetical protein